MKGAPIRAGGPTALTTDLLLTFYVWHFLEAVPLLDVNGTLRWPAPATYEGAAVGWLLLAFKVAVILPVIAAFRGWWVDVHEAAEAPGGRSARAA